MPVGRNIVNKYEILYVLEPQDETRKETIGWIKEHYESIGAHLLKEEEMGKRRLAFELRKKTDGFYYMTQVEIDDLSPLEDFEKEARINPNVLRFIKLKLG